MDYSTMTPAQARALIREEKITGQTSGMCAGYAQANLVILPKDLAMISFYLHRGTQNPARFWKSVMWEAGSFIILQKMWTLPEIFRNTEFTEKESWQENIQMWRNFGRMTLSVF